jgi:hypothetical protein
MMNYYFLFEEAWVVFLGGALIFAAFIVFNEQELLLDKEDRGAWLWPRLGFRILLAMAVHIGLARLLATWIGAVWGATLALILIALFILYSKIFGEDGENGDDA